MQRQGVHHRPKGSDVYVWQEGILHLRLRTGTDVARAIAIYGDKYDWAATAAEQALTLIGSDADYVLIARNTMYILWG